MASPIRRVGAQNLMWVQSSSTRQRTQLTFGYIVTESPEHTAQHRRLARTLRSIGPSVPTAVIYNEQMPALDESKDDRIRRIVREAKDGNSSKIASIISTVSAKTATHTAPTL